MSFFALALTALYQFFLYFWSLVTFRRASPSEPDLELGIASPQAHSEVPVRFSATTPTIGANTASNVADNTQAPQDHRADNDPRVNSDTTLPRVPPTEIASSQLPATASPAPPPSPSLHLDTPDLSIISTAASSPPRTPNFASTLAAFPEPPPLAIPDNVLLSSPDHFARLLDRCSTPPQKDTLAPLSLSLSRLRSLSPTTPEKATALVSKFATLIRPSPPASGEALPCAPPAEADADPFGTCTPSFFADSVPADDLAHIFVPHPHLYDFSIYAGAKLRPRAHAAGPTYVADVSLGVVSGSEFDDYTLPREPGPLPAAPYPALGAWTLSLPLGSPIGASGVPRTGGLPSGSGPAPLSAQLATMSLSDNSPRDLAMTTLPQTVTDHGTAPVADGTTTPTTTSTDASPVTAPESFSHTVDEPDGSDPSREARSDEPLSTSSSLEAYPEDHATSSLSLEVHPKEQEREDGVIIPAVSDAAPGLREATRRRRLRLSTVTTGSPSHDECAEQPVSCHSSPEAPPEEHKGGREEDSLPEQREPVDVLPEGHAPQEEGIPPVVIDAMPESHDAAERRRSRQLDDLISLLDTSVSIGEDLDAQPIDEEPEEFEVALSDSGVLPVVAFSEFPVPAVVGLVGVADVEEDEWESEDFEDFAEPPEHRLSRSIEDIISLLEECRDAVPVTEYHTAEEEPQDKHAGALVL